MNFCQCCGSMTAKEYKSLNGKEIALCDTCRKYMHGLIRDEKRKDSKK